MVENNTMTLTSSACEYQYITISYRNVSASVVKVPSLVYQKLF
jgi:hypothetical protein